MRFTWGVKELDRGWKDLLATLKAAKKDGSYVAAGLLGAGAHEQNGDLTNAQLGALHEYGTRHIPARPWVAPAFAQHRNEYVTLLTRGLLLVLRGKLTIEAALGVIGVRMAADIKNYVTAGASIPPPLAEETVRHKGSTRALVDTGRMIGAVTWAVITRAAKP